MYACLVTLCGAASQWQVLRRVPLYVVTEERIGLLGAREQAAKLVEQQLG